PKAPHSSDYAPYPKLDPNDVAPPPPPISDDASTTMLPEFNPYISPSPARKRHAWEMGENGSRHRQEGSGSLREDKTVQFD
ncbi:hypothetical protein HID58_018697, partial [Brassica napus]